MINNSILFKQANTDSLCTFPDNVFGALETFIGHNARSNCLGDVITPSGILSVVLQADSDKTMIINTNCFIAITITFGLMKEPKNSSWLIPWL